MDVLDPQNIHEDTMVLEPQNWSNFFGTSYSEFTEFSTS